VELLAPHPTKLEDHPLSAAHNCLFNVIPDTLHIWRPYPPSTIWIHHAMVTDPHNMVRTEILYNILFENGIPMELARLITMCLNKTGSKVHIGEFL
jgi:hypothetical protein